MDIRETLKDKSRIIIKIGSSSLTHPQTGALDLTKLEILIREICNIKNMGKDVILVSSGAIAVGSRSAGFQRKPQKLEEKQALCCHWSGTADDDLSEAVCRIWSYGCTGADDQEYDYE